MKISICIPQYNRIQWLLKSLHIIANQTHDDIEIVVSDDGSTDETEAEINALKAVYRYPITYKKNVINLGYDRNFRQSVELATGDYCIVIGNDDTIYEENTIEFMVNFLKDNNLPDLGFCNFVEDNNPGEVVQRAMQTAVLGTGPDVVMKYYSCFTFVGGLVYKKSAFDKYNTDKHDGSVFSQIYLNCLMVASGCRLFSIKEPVVLKDLYLNGKFRHSYRDRIAKKWKGFKVVNAGLPTVMHVVIAALEDANALTQKMVFSIFKRVYTLTYPHWILDYKLNKAVPEAFGVVAGLHPPKVPDYYKLNIINKVKIYSLYLGSTAMALITPSRLFAKYKNRLYKFFKSRST